MSAPIYPGGFERSVSSILDQFLVSDKMVKLTMIARVTDGLPLAEGLDDGRDQKDIEFYKQQAKLLFKNLSKGQHEASRMSIETGPYFFQYPLMCAFHHFTQYNGYHLHHL